MSKFSKVGRRALRPFDRDDPWGCHLQPRGRPARPHRVWWL